MPAPCRPRAGRILSRAMSASAPSKRIGFQSWYERQLFLSFAWLTSCILCGVLIAVLLEFVGLYSKRRLRGGDLSFGQQKLLEFAMALMNRPKVLLLDEPTAGINPTLINGLVDRLKRANTELGITLFVIEHNMRVVMNLAEHIYCLAHGEMLAAGSPEEVQGNQLVIDAYLGAH